MLKLFFPKYRSWILIVLLTLSMYGGFSRPAQAGKFMSSFIFDPSSGMVEVAKIYETSLATQKSAMKSLKVSSKLMKKSAGFKGLAMLQSQDGQQIVTFSQWQDLDSYQAYSSSLIPVSTKSNSSNPALVPPEPSRIVMFEITDAQTSFEGATPALRGKEAVVQFFQFSGKTSAKTDEARSPILDRVEEMIPDLMRKQPIPQSVVVLKEIASDNYALLTNWNCSALFEDVGQPTVIEPSEELMSLADSEQRIYDVVSLIPAPVIKEGKSNPYY